MQNSPCVIALWASRRAGITQGKCQSPKTQPSYPDIIGVGCLLLVACYSFVIRLTSTALAHFAHLTVGLGIYAFGFDLSFEIIWQSRDNSRQSRWPLTTPIEDPAMRGRTLSSKMK